MNRRRVPAVIAMALLAPLTAWAYPGGTPSYQTDAAPFCAGCHSSRSPDALEGTGERAAKEVAESKHVAVILAGHKGYSKLTEPDRQTLAEQIRAIDAASTVSIKAPKTAKPATPFRFR